MNYKYIIYAVIVIIVTTVGAWAGMVGDSTSGGRGSSWSSGTGGGAYSGGRHK